MLADLKTDYIQTEATVSTGRKSLLAPIQISTQTCQNTRSKQNYIKKGTKTRKSKQSCKSSIDLPIKTKKLRLYHCHENDKDYDTNDSFFI